MDHEALLKLWKLDEIPACDEGMQLARVFRQGVVQARARTDEECPGGSYSFLVSTLLVAYHLR